MNRLLIILIAAMLSGCVSTGSQRPARKPATPPMPPGFKATVATPQKSARFTPASVPTVTPGTGIMQAPEIYNDPDFGRIFLARAYQGPNTELHVTGGTDLQSWSPVAIFGCWGTEQVFLVATSGAGPYRFMRGSHVACAPTFQPASAVRLGPAKDFILKSGPVKAARVEGASVADGVTIWKVLP